MKWPLRGPGWFGVSVWVVLALPVSRHLLESGMLLHMLVQLPLLAVCGWCVAVTVPFRSSQALAAWNHRGISGLLLASLVALVWMLPLGLDAAIVDWRVELAKFLTVPVLLGMALTISWPRAGFVVRGLVLSEAVAMCFRIGWLYLAAPTRLCANYRIDEQQLLGKALIMLGALTLAVLALKLLVGHVVVNPVCDVVETENPLENRKPER